MKILLEYDELTRTETWFEYNSLTDETTLSTVCDVEPHLEANKELANDPSYSSDGMRAGLWHYATIPNAVIEQWKKEGLDIYDRNHMPAILKRLNDPACKYLKVTTKHHS